MSEMPICPRCHKTAQTADAAFCAYCGAPMKQAPAQEVPAEVQALLIRLADTPDPKKRYELLTQAQQQYPDSLPIARELLYLGRLHERGGKYVDFSVIKCYLLHMYLTPSDFKEDKKTAMRQELFHHPQLQRCQELAPDADDFTREYLRHLSAEFSGLFLKGSSTYMRSFFGLRLGGRPEKLLADPASRVLANIHGDTDLDGDEREMLYQCFYQGYIKEIGGENELNAKLDQYHLPIPPKA